MAYLRSRASNGLLRGDLGDWIAGDGTTPATATGTYGYYMTVSTTPPDRQRTSGRRRDDLDRSS